MMLDKKLVTDIAIDIDVAMMSCKRCTTKPGESNIPSLLGLDDTKENYNLIERYVFWNIVWRHLSELGWILDKDGNFESSFITLPPFDPICNTMKKNIDFFDDEAELMMSFSSDPRLFGIKELRELRERFDDYVFQFNELKSMFVGRSLPSELEDNKNVLKYLESRVEAQKNRRELEKALVGDGKEKSNLMLQKKLEQQEKYARPAFLPIDARHSRRLHREMIIAEYERRKQLNGGKFPTHAPLPLTKHPEVDSAPLNAQLCKARTILEVEQQNACAAKMREEAKIRDAITKACKPPPTALKLEKLKKQQQQSRASLQYLLPSRRRRSGFPQAASIMNSGLVTGSIAGSMDTHTANKPRRVSLPQPAASPIEAQLRGVIATGEFPMQTSMSSSNNSSSSLSHIDQNLQDCTNGTTDMNLKLSWNEIQTAFHDLKNPTLPQNPAMLEATNVSTVDPAQNGLQQLFLQKANALGPQSKLQEMFMSRKRQRLF